MVMWMTSRVRIRSVSGWVPRSIGTCHSAHRALSWKRALTLSKGPSGRPGRSADGGAEPRGQVANQVRLVVAYPRDMTVRPEQHRGDVQLVAHADDVVDPVGPARRGQPAGLVEQHPPAVAHPFVEATR